MNPQEFADMKNRISDLDISMNDIVKRLASLSIDQQNSVVGNTPIPPGIACKLAYDSKGLVLNGMKLEEVDIPELGIDKISSLRKILEDKVGFSDIKGIQLNPNDKPKKKNDTVVGVGTKVSYNEDGCIVSTSDLSTNDIPTLPIEKIENLHERLYLLESQYNQTNTEVPEYQIVPGTFPKITYDTKGRVVSGSKLSLDDIPMDLILKINAVENRIPDLASSKSLSALAEDVRTKVEENNPIVAGTFSKVTVDSKGLVTKGHKISINDLPELKISDILKLEATLRSKAEQDTVVQLSETVSALVSSMSQVGEINGIKSELSMKADDDEVKKISSKLNHLQSLVDTLSAKIPNELIMEQLQLIQSELSSLSGRISVVENVLRMQDSFDTTE